MRNWDEILSDVLYDEEKVPSYTLPSPLDYPGTSRRVRTSFEWMNTRREEIRSLYEKELFGVIPPRADSTTFEVLSCDEESLEGTAVRKEIRICSRMNNGKEHSMILLLYLPKNCPGRCGAFAGLNFRGNHTTTDEKDVTLTGALFPRNQEDYREEARGKHLELWNHRENILRGYASATICYHDIFPDHEGGWADSIYKIFYEDPASAEVKAKHTAIGAWAWGLSRIMDYLETEACIDPRKVAVHGHSRLGKTALWVGANDLRFNLVISNDSGCAGAALFKRCFGENAECIYYNFPRWFVPAFAKYIRKEDSMEFDQHFLLGLMAPRPVCVASATEDLWADPKGEFLSCKAAAEVYELFGAGGNMKNASFPPADTFLTGEISYHLRTGKHYQAHFDWEHYLLLADKFFFNKE